MTVATQIGVFPLEMVLSPSAFVPLRIFEPRYRQLLIDVAQTDNRFGVVLITRGQEVGETHTNPDMARARVGTMARVVESQTRDGQVQIVIEGEDRFEVQTWLRDNPYPQALVVPFGHPRSGRGATEQTGAKQIDEVLILQARSELQGLIDLVRESGHHVRSLPEPNDDLWLTVDELCAQAPVSTIDQQLLLETPGPNERLSTLCSLVSELRAFVEMQREANS